jgi:molecular chaperone HtpG
MTAETHRFQAEANQVLDLMIHSLYSNKEIFLRELISNASDALDKLRFEALSRPDLLPGGEELEIRIEADETAHTLRITDNGIGMSRDEVVENIGTIAKSGTRELLRQLKESKAAGAPTDLIGQFGVGFYAVFMVADRVVIETRRAGETRGTRWESDGKDSFTVDEIDRDHQGTAITLHLKDTDEEHGLQDFTDEWVIRRIVTKYSDFVGYPVRLGSETLNSMKPIWTRPEDEVSEEDYAQFYKSISHDWGEPLKRLRFQAEGTSEYTALLFLPKQPPFDLFQADMKHGLRLYVKRVLIQDRSEDLLPRFLRMVKGVVESQDLPLNVSREVLQHNRLVAQIRKRITKKVLDALQDMQQNAPDDYLAFWNAFGLVLKEGIAARDDNREKIADLLLLQSTADAAKPTTLGNYVARMKEGQEHIYYLTGESKALLEASPHLEAVKDKGYEVLLLVDPIDEFMMRVMTEYQSKKFQALGKGAVDLGGSADEKKKEEEERKDREKALGSVLEAFQTRLDAHVKEVRVSTRLKESAVCLVDDENQLSPHLERLLNPGQPAPVRRRILEVNPNHPVLAGLQKRIEAKADDPRVQDYIDLLYGQALLAEGEELPDPRRFNAVLTELLGASL